jgi:putative ATPase
MDLFDQIAKNYYQRHAPLSERMRPNTWEQYVGQATLLSSGSPIRIALQGGALCSLILWGPPGSGKTTLARLLAQKLEFHFEALSAVHSGKKEILEIEKQSEERIRLYSKKTLLFIDEIHRLNKIQQDGLLAAVEKGVFTLMGATTENPSFSLTSALLSRCQVAILTPLSLDDLKCIAFRALEDSEIGLGKTRMKISTQALSELLRLSNGDARSLLNLLELAAMAAAERHRGLGTEVSLRDIDCEDLSRGIDKRRVLYDKTGDEHYNTISAFIKSIRGSDPQAAVYYLARMIEGGEDPLFIARRLAILASEDIGNADPQAVILASSIFQTLKEIGLPEGRISLAQLTLYLALAPKSNASYVAIEEALSEVQKSGALSIPKKLRNAPTRFLKDLGYGENYHYAHDSKDGFYPEDFLPEEIFGKIFYVPTERGFEKNLKDRLDRLKDQKNL